MSSRALLALQRRRRWEVWTLPLWCIAAGLGGVLVLARFDADPLARGWMFGGAILLALVLRLCRRLPLRDVARACDARTSARSRLEAVTELGSRDDALAHAIADDADRFLAAHPLPRPYGWLAAVTLTLIFAGANLVVLLRSATPAPSARSAPVAHTSTSDTGTISSTADTASIEKPAPPAPAAGLRWLTPEGDIDATPQQQVALLAESESITGLRAVALHVIVDGEPRAPIAVAENVAPAVQTISTQLALDTLATAEHTTVAYYLAAERVRPSELPAEPVWPAVVSPLQFVRLRAASDTNVLELPASDPASGLLVAVRTLQQEQRRAAQETFALEHGLPVRNEADEPINAENVTARQNAIAEATNEVIAMARDATIAKEGVQALERASSETRIAAAALAGRQLGAARTPQAHVLTQLGAAEKVVTERVRENQARRAAEDAERMARLAKTAGEGLMPRAQTPAGRLETLAAEQKTLAERLAERSGSEGLFADQDRVARGVAKLGDEKSLPVNVAELLPAAAEAAKEAASQLNEQDALAAVEPATRAAQALAEAVNRLEADGRARSAAELLAAQEGLLGAALELQDASAGRFAAAAKKAGEETKQLQQQLRQAARREQQAGSAEAAEKLEQLAKAIKDAEIEKQLQRPEDKKDASEKLEQLAQRAADAANQVGDRKKIQQAAQEELEEMKRQLKGPPSSQADLARMSTELNANSQRLREPKQFNRRLPPPGPGAGPKELADYAAQLAPRVDGLLQFATEALRESKRVQRLTTANPAEAPPAYRPAVAEYFESLARARTPPPAATGAGTGKP